MIKTIIGTTRPPFLILTVTSVLLALAWLIYNEMLWNKGLFFLVLIGALFAHISVNMLNEYEDFKSGLDFQTEKTPFSGGSGSLQQNPEHAEKVALIAYSLLGALISIGVFFIYLRGWYILPIGFFGVIIILSYTSWITRYPLLCLFIAGFAFGPLMVNGAYFVLVGEYNLTLFIVSMIPFFLVNNLLLLNQIPDIKADKDVGRYNFLHKYGLNAGVMVYFINWLLAFVILGLLLLLNILPVYVSITVVALFISIPLLLAVFKSKTDKGKLNSAMGLNVMLTLITPALISLGLIL